MRETKVEARLRKACESRGVYIRKFTSPGHVGVPDRLIVLRGRPIFIETKAPEGDLKSWQEREHRRIRNAGAIVYTVYTLEQVDAFVEDYLDDEL